MRALSRCFGAALVICLLLAMLPSLAYARTTDRCNNPPCQTLQTIVVHGSYGHEAHPGELNNYSAGTGGSYSNGEGIFSPVSITATAQPKTSKSNGSKDIAGEPIEISSGTKISTQTFFALPGEMGLRYVRYYRSGSTGWTDNTDYSLDTHCGSTYPDGCHSITLYRPDGSSIKFRGIPDVVGNYPEAGGGGLATLAYTANATYVLQDEDATTQTYDEGGTLLSIKDASGIGWTLTRSYNSQTLAWTTRVTHTDGQFMNIVRASATTVTDPAGNVYTDVGNSNGDTVTYPGSPTTAITYKYGPYGETEADFNGVPYVYTTYYDYAIGNGAHLYLANNTHMADGSQATSISYAFPSGQVSNITNALGHTATNQYNWTHDSNGDYYYQLASTTEPAVVDGPTTTETRSYDGNGNLTQTVDGNGVAHTYNYAVNGQLQTETEAAGTSVARTTDYVWDPNAQLNRPLSITVEGETKTTYTYNAQNRIASVTRTNLTAVGTPNQTIGQTYTYTLYGNGMVASMVATTSSPGGTDKTTTNYDTLGNVTSIVDGLGHTTTSTGYNALGQPGHITGPNGDATDFTYDARGRIATKTTHPYSTPSNPNGVPTTWTYSYDGFGLVSKIVDYDGTTTTTRNAYQQITSITHNDKDGLSTETFGYDANGDVTSDVVARGSDIGKSTTTVYDALGRVYQRKGAHGQVLTYAYDGNGNVLSITDALGHKTTNVYDALNRLIKTANAAGGVTQYAYDTGDHLTRVTDPRGLVTTSSFDGLGLLWNQVSPDSGTTTLTYDAYGRLASKTRADGVQTTYAYDAVNRVTRATAASQSQTWAYDTCTYGKGRLCAVTDAHTATSYSYSPEGWVVGRGFTVDGKTYALGYGYDVMGQPSIVVYPDGNRATYYYDWGAISQVVLTVGSSSLNGTTNITYRPMDMAMSGWTSNNGLTNTIQYDTDLRPTSIAVPGIQNLSFTYDNADRISKITNGIDGTMTQGFAYDALNRLYTVRSSADNEDLRYDADGNRTLGIVNGTTTNYYPAASSNRLDHTVSGAVTTTYGYDAQGNWIGGAQSSGGDPSYHLPLAYDSFDRLRTYGTGASLTTFDVNPEGQRLRKSNSSNTTYFAPDAGGTLEADDSNGVWSDYVWLNGRPIALIRNGVTYAIHDDHLGRPQAVTRPDTYTVWVTENYPYRRKVITDLIGGLNLGYPGQYQDSETGYWNNGARDYDQGAERYIESDPIGLLGGVNTYAYVGNNPISNVDPLGLYWFRQPWQTPGIVGRRGTPVPPGGPISQFMEGYVPAGYTFGQMHDSFVDAATQAGIPDWLANIPSMGTVYDAALITEVLRTFGILKQPTPPAPPCP